MDDPLQIQEVLDAYPTIKILVSYVETIICIPEPPNPSAWSLLVGPDNKNCYLTPNEVVKSIGDILIREMAYPDNPPIYNILVSKMLSDTKTTEFLNYIKGKMGAV